MTKIEKERVVGALAETWTSILGLCQDLTVEEWASSTDCPGWTVQDQVAHIVGVERGLAGEPVPELDADRFDYLRNAMGRSNEAWIDQRRGSEPREVLAELRSVAAARLESLAAMSLAELDTETATPAGRDTYGRLVQIRVMDSWVHEQDIREAIGRPGHEDGQAVEVSLDEVSLALGFVVGKKAAARPGSSVRFALTGGSARTIDVVVDERARVSDHPVTDPTTTLTMPVVVFMRLVGGRTSAGTRRADGSVEVTGDQALGTRVLENLAYMI